MALNNKLLIALITLVIIGGGLTILQMWVPVIGWDVYVKILATLGILGLIIGLVMVLKSDLGSNKDMKDQNYLD